MSPAAWPVVQGDPVVTVQKTTLGRQAAGLPSLNPLPPLPRAHPRTTLAHQGPPCRGRLLRPERGVVTYADHRTGTPIRVSGGA